MGAKKCSQRQEEAVSGRSVGKRLVSGLPPSSSSSVGRPACQQLEIRSVPFPQTPALSPHFHGEAPQRWGLYSPPTPLSAQCILASATELLGGGAERPRFPTAVVLLRPYVLKGRLSSFLPSCSFSATLQLAPPRAASRSAHLPCATAPDPSLP